jgi:hypothetical protein
MDFAPRNRHDPVTPTPPACTISRARSLRRALRLPPGPPGGALLACAALAFASGSAAAAGFGAITQQSALGQPLRIVIPVNLAAGEELPADCLKLASTERDADGIPQLVLGRIDLERAPSGTRLVVSHSRPVNDPVVRLTIQAGCDIAVRREYVLLMDPPPIEPPLVAADSAPRNEAAAAPPPAAAARGPARGSATGAPRAGTRATGAGTQASRKPAKSAAAKPRTGAKTALGRQARTAGGQPRLTVSSAPPPAGAIGGATAIADAPQAQSQQELANAIEAETVVLQQRIVELTALVDRMQREVQAGELAERAAAEAARTAAEKAAKRAAQASPLDKAARWLNANWAVLAAIVGLPLLIAGGLLWKRRRDAARDALRLVTGRPTGRTATGAAARPAPTLRNAPAGVLLPDAGIAARPGTPTRAPARPPPQPATERPRMRKPMPPESPPTARPPQRRLAFELDFDADVRKTRTKPSS